MARLWTTSVESRPCLSGREPHCTRMPDEPLGHAAVRPGHVGPQRGDVRRTAHGSKAVLWRNEISWVDTSIRKNESHRRSSDKARSPGKWAKSHELGMRNRGNDECRRLGGKSENPCERI